MSRFFLLLVILFYLFVSICFAKSVKPIFPENLDRSHSCASDGMVIIDYKGPKAQILWKNGNRTFYCEVREAFFEKFDVIKKKQIIVVFVQDFSFLEWGSYKDKWILADDAFYVIDSKKNGAMGITYVPFLDYDEAKLFKSKFGGVILKFEEINIDILFSSDVLLKERGIF